MCRREAVKYFLSEKVNILDEVKEEKKSYAEAAKTYNKYTSSTCEIVKNEKNICASFAVAPPAAKIMPMVHAKSLVKMEKAFGKSLQLGTSLVVWWLRPQCSQCRWPGFNPWSEN